MEEKQKTIIIGVITAVVAFIAAYFLFQFIENKNSNIEENKEISLHQPKEEKPIMEKSAARYPQAENVTPTQVKPEETAQLIKNKSIDGKSYILRLSNSKEWITLCQSQSLIRKIVAVTLAVSKDENPAVFFKDKNILSEFKVVTGKGKTFLSTTNYERVNFIIEVIEKTPAENIVAFLKSMDKELNLALKDLGENQTFKTVMNKAVDNAIKKRVNIKGLIQLKKKINTYEFVNPKHEKLSPISKIFIRMGEKNSNIIINYIKEIKNNY